jgi:hypothetical protein
VRRGGLRPSIVQRPEGGVGCTDSRRERMRAWSLCDRDLRDRFRQSCKAPYRGVEPVRTALNLAILLAGKRHHLGFEPIAT